MFCYYHLPATIRTLDLKKNYILLEILKKFLSTHYQVVHTQLYDVVWLRSVRRENNDAIMTKKSSNAYTKKMKMFWNVSYFQVVIIAFPPRRLTLRDFVFFPSSFLFVTDLKTARMTHLNYFFDPLSSHTNTHTHIL
jgi:hypothetical protein